MKQPKKTRKVRAIQAVKSPLYKPMSEMAVGDTTWIEVPGGEDYVMLMKRVVNVQRYPRQMEDMEFSSRLYVALQVRHLTDQPIMLLNVVRVK